MCVVSDVGMCVVCVWWLCVCVKETAHTHARTSTKRVLGLLPSLVPPSRPRVQALIVLGLDCFSSYLPCLRPLILTLPQCFLYSTTNVILSNLI